MEKCSIKKSFSHYSYHYEKTDELAKMGNEVRVILKWHDGSDCQIKSGSWLKQGSCFLA